MLKLLIHERKIIFFNKKIRKTKKVIIIKSLFIEKSEMKIKFFLGDKFLLQKKYILIYTTRHSYAKIINFLIHLYNFSVQFMKIILFQ